MSVMGRVTGGVKFGSVCAHKHGRQGRGVHGFCWGARDPPVSCVTGSWFSGAGIRTRARACAWSLCVSPRTCASGYVWVSMWMWLQPLLMRSLCCEKF